MSSKKSSTRKEASCLHIGTVPSRRSRLSRKRRKPPSVASRLMQKKRVASVSTAVTHRQDGFFSRGHIKKLVPIRFYLLSLLFTYCHVVTHRHSCCDRSCANHC